MAAVVDLLEQQGIESLKQRGPLTHRPTLTGGHVDPVHPPQAIGDRFPPVCAVIGDGLCLYYCVLAARDIAHWLSTHNAKGAALTSAVADADLLNANSLRDQVRDQAQLQGVEEVVQRMCQSGRDGYPMLEEVDILAGLIGGV